MSDKTRLLDAILPGRTTTPNPIPGLESQLAAARAAQSNHWEAMGMHGLDVEAGVVGAEAQHATATKGYEASMTEVARLESMLEAARTRQAATVDAAAAADEQRRTNAVNGILRDDIPAAGAEVDSAFDQLDNALAKLDASRQRLADLGAPTAIFTRLANARLYLPGILAYRTGAGRRVPFMDASRAKFASHLPTGA